MGVAIQAFGSVTTLDPSHAAGWANLARAFIKSGQPQRAETAVEHAIKAGTEDPMVEDLIGVTLSSLGDQHGAKQWAERAASQSPTSARFNLNLASSQIFLGENEEAEVTLDRVLKINPADPQAHWRKSSLQTAGDGTHLLELTSLLKQYETNPRALSFVAYAAGKEYEDLGEWVKAFECFEKGARAKRRIVEYDETEEVAMFEALHETFTHEWVSKGRRVMIPPPLFSSSANPALAQH